MAKAKRRRRRSRAVAVRRNPPTSKRRRRRRSSGIRRNPLSLLTSRSSGVVGMITSGAKVAGLILAGKGATNYLSRMIPTPGDPANPSQVLEVGKRVAVGLGLGYAAKRMMGADAARLVVAGAFLSPIEAGIRAIAPPAVAAALASDEELVVLGEYYQRLGTYVDGGGPVNINGATRTIGDNAGSNMDQGFSMAAGY